MSDLCDGELIHGVNFNLFAAMSALEVMFGYSLGASFLIIGTFLLQYSLHLAWHV